MKQMLKKIIRNNNFLSLGGNIAASGLGFLSFAILVRFLEKDIFGNWIIFLTLATLTDTLRTGLLQTGLIKFMSGKDEQVQKVVVGTGWIFSLLVTGGIALVCFGLYFFTKDIVKTQGVVSFFKWYPVLTLISLPFNFATWYLQANMRFQHLLFIRTIILIAFVSQMIYFLYELNLELVIQMYLVSQAVCSAVCMICKWTKVRFIRFARKRCLEKLFNFGKYSMGTMIGANMLRNSDTLLIGAMLNPEAVALYSVPLKLFEIVEIPLRSFVATALPTMSRFFNSGEKSKISDFFERTSGLFTVVLIPFVLLGLLFAEPLVRILGGEGYAESANIFRVFAVFALLMPLDRYSGVALDILNRPALNFIKVGLMLLVNIAGDVLVIYISGKVFPVAVVSILTFTTGVVFGMVFLKKYISFSVKGLVFKGFSEVRTAFVKIKNKIKPATN